MARTGDLQGIATVLSWEHNDTSATAPGTKREQLKRG